MRSRFHRALPVCATLSVAFFVAFAVVKAAIGIPSGTPYSQTFDSIGTTATATLPLDFRADRTTTATSSDMRKVGAFAAAGTTTTQFGGANLSTSAANGIYNFGSGTTTTGPDRAIGFLASGTATASGNLYAQLTNNTGGPLTGLQISYDVEKYRNGSNAAGFRIQLFYSTDGATWTSAGSDFLTAFAADGNNNGFATAPGTTVSVASKTLSVAIPTGSTFYLAWNYSVSTGSTVTNAQALAIDNVSIVGVATGGDVAPSVSSTTPVTGTTNVPVNSTIVINFSESVNASASAFSLECPGGSARTFTQTASPAATFVLTPNSPLPAGTTCTVKVTANEVTDIDPPPNTMASDYNFSFTTASPTDTAPSVTGVAPANGAPNVPVNSSIVIDFSESVTASPTAFSIQCPAGVPQSFVQSAGPSTTFTLTPSSSLPYSTACTVSVTADQISDTDAIDPPDGLASNAAFSFTTAAAPPPGAGKVIINEVDADTPGSDTAEFIELYDGGLGNTPLDGLVVVLYDGGLSPFTGNQSYAAFDLTGKSTDANGYFVLGNPGVPNAGLTFDPGDFGLLQNGPDAVALYVGHASDFPNGTIVTTTNLLDAIVYGTDDPNPTKLMTLINAGQVIVNENATGNGTTQSSQRCPDGLGGFRNTSSYYPGAPTPGAANHCPAARPPGNVVISQIYGGGGNSGAIYLNDFVELYNRGASTVDLSGWSFQYSPAASNGSSFLVQPIGGSIGPGQYYLIQLASGGSGGAPLPVDANIIGNINISSTSGKVALVNSFDALLGGCPIYDPHIMDFVGYGTADCSEGLKAAPQLSNTSADFRKAGGSQDTDVNGDDFGPSAAPSPRRTAPVVELGPFVFKTDPVRNGLNAPRDATIDVTFTEAVTVDSAWFNITCVSSGDHNSATSASSLGGQDQYITPNDNFIAGEQCTVTIFKDRVHDVDLNDFGPNTDTLTADYSWSFTVATGTEPPYPPSVHLTMGNPSAAGSDPSNYLMTKPEFVLSYNRDLGRPNWVSWHLSDEWVGTLTRVDTFRPDPQVPPEWYRVQAFDFSGSGFDRGHMTPNADRDKETSIPINQATFLMSNMVAQAPGNNQGPWAAFEGYLRTLVEQEHDELYIVSGPAGVGGTGSLGGVTATLANGHVTVPSSTWKVVLVLPKDGGDDLSRVSCSTRTIAVIMPNQDSIRNDPWENYLTTVDAVETLTGYNFFSNLPEPYQQCIEAGTNGSNPPLVKGNQTITFATPADRNFGDPAFTVFATGGASGNPVTFAASGACTSGGFNGATITMLAPGSCVITASQAGNDIYNAAADVVRTFSVIDAVAPTASPTQSPTATAGWNNTNVTVTWNWTDTGGSGIDTANCTTSSTSSGEGNAIALGATCKDLSGNTGTASYGVMVDKTAPTVSAAAISAPNANGWYNGNVTVAFTCADALSGVATCPPAQTLSAEGSAVMSTPQTAFDVAGNSATSNVVTASIDKTVPIVALTGGPTDGGSYYFGAVPPAPICSASDALSGLASCTVAGYSTVVGQHTVSATAMDKAGNATTASATYTVLPWTFSGFYPPIDTGGVWNTVKNGSTVPLKFKVFAGSTELTSTSVVVQPLTATQALCSGGPTDDIELLATGGTSLRYDTSAGLFIYNWQTPKNAGFCYVVTITLADGSSLSGKFQLR